METPTRFVSQPASKAPAVGSPGARREFNTNSIRKFVNDRGARAKWERSWYCTCRNINTKQPDPTCPICLGRGIAYQPAVDITIIVQSQERGPNSVDLGLYDSGTAIGTTNVNEPLSFRDRITLPDIKIYQSMIFDVTQSRVEDGMYLYYDVKGLEMVRGVLQGEHGQDLVEGEDYTLDKKRNLFFPYPHLLGTNVSMNIQTTLRYIVVDLLKESRYQYTEKYHGPDNPLYEELPRKLLLKREDIFINPEPFSLQSNTAEVMRASAIEDDLLLNAKREGTNEARGGFFGGRI